MRLTVFGTGYLGATHAACLAEMGHQVLGVDVCARKVARLNDARPPFHEPGLSEVLRRNLRRGRLRFTTSYAEAAAFATTHFLAVGTPAHKSHTAGSSASPIDTSQLTEVLRTLVPLLRGRHLILGKSTVPVGTAAALAQQVGQWQRQATSPGGAAEIHIAWNPEFLREGKAVSDTLRPDRIVLGISDANSWAVPHVREIYRDCLAAGCPLLVMDVATAELVKVAANAFLATKLSFINAMADVCAAAGADVGQLARAVGMDPRIGGAYFQAGLGYGGGCLPKDVRGFVATSEQLGVHTASGLLRQVDAINEGRRDRVVALARQLVGGEVAGRRIAVLGASFKPDSDDVRDSPALVIAARLHGEGARVAVWDPQAQANAAALHPQLEYPSSVTAAAEAAELVIVATEWGEFRRLDSHQLRRAVAVPRMLDARNCLARAEWEAAGWQLVQLGQ